MPCLTAPQVIDDPARPRTSNTRFTGAASPGAAWANGLQAARAGQLDAAKLWLERAVRLAPADPRIGLDLANLRIRLRSPAELTAAIASLAALGNRHNEAAIELARLSAEHLTGNRIAAAATLARLLARHCIPADKDFAAVAGMICGAAQLPGWCGLHPSGALHVSATATIRLDGAEITPTTALPPAGTLRITSHGQDLAGSPLDLSRLNRTLGIAAAVEGGLTGWAYRPAAPGTPPKLTLTDAKGVVIQVKPGNLLPPDEAAPFVRKFSFAIPAARLKTLTPPFRLAGPDGNNLMGSPLNPAALAAIPPLAAASIGSPVTLLPARAALAVIIPVFRNLPYTQACLAAVQASAPAGTQIIVIDDASPEPSLCAWARDVAATGEITLIRHAENQGFPAAVNAGLAFAAGRDVLLLNSDTITPPGAIPALIDAAYAAADIGSVTPFSNDATILSVPNPQGGNKMPNLAQATALQAAAAAANGRQIAEIPTGIGFCMYLRHDCLAATGGFRPEIFAQGYGEENDWCLRARHLGYRHVAALGAYVAHHGGTSFRAEGAALNARNAGILARLYPGYDALIQEFLRADPLAEARAAFDAARFAQGRRSQAVLLISHNHGGGVGRIVTGQMQALRESGSRPLLLIPAAPEDLDNTPFPWDAELTDGEPGDYPGLRFKYPAARDHLLAVLRAESVSHVVLHHGLGHHPGIRNLAAELGVPQEIVLHDYASFCPRVNLLSHRLTSEPLRYCGEPDLKTCETCVETAGDETFEYLGPAALAARSRAEFAAASRITAPSPDTANRIARHFPGIRPNVTPWQDDSAPAPLTPPRQGQRRIAIIGGIGPAKGYDVLMDCARDAARRKLGLEFVVAGTSADDKKLLETGLIFVTGAYQEGEATRLIKSLNADLAFLPSIWPETWCFALSEAWAAGLYTIAFDLGAQAARLKATRRGAVLPLGLPVPRINDMLLAWQPDLRDITATPPAPKTLENKVY
jgi:GT2 family glycosyltransferase/glycosyltransferase involved in cell wall biosynthesis